MTIRKITHDAADAVLRLAHTVASAEEIQWEASPRPRVECERGKGEGAYADPTFDTVTDEYRLALRRNVEAALTQLRLATAATRDADAKLRAAIREWEGSE